MKPRSLFICMLAAFSTVSIARSEAFAMNCSAAGGLLFLGTAANDTRSVWLSGTSAGMFELEAAQGNQTVDQWSKSRPGLRLSLSPVVSQGNGGVHRLLDASGMGNCLLATQNQKPIFSLPPGFTRPPPRPVTPGLPPIGGGVRPPGGGTQPPTIGGGTQAPIGTLPPTGITPGLPPVGGGTRPPGGGTRPPTIGGGTQPPIGTLPPTGVTPGLPSGPQPPGGGGVQPPIGTLPPGGAGPEQGLEARQALGASEDCIDPRSSEANDTDRKDQRPLCSDNAAALQDAASADADPVPITPGRDLIEPTVWNIWSDVNLQDSSDERFGRDNDSLSGSLSFGADRKVDERAVMGLSITFDGSKTEGFDGFFEARSKGVSMGPYAAYRLSEHWAVDGTLTYGVSENELEIVTLEGDYDAQRFTASANLNGQYLVEDLVLRPQVSLYYAYTETKAYDLSGSILGTPVSVRFPSDSYDYATLELSNEFSRTYDVGEGRRVMPYLDIGLLYEFERPNDGKIVGGDLRLRRPSPVSGSVRGGVRAQLADRLLVEGSLGYLSIGQSGLDTFEAGLYLSYGF